MSFINFLGLEDPNYGNYAKGILYVIYDILWKIVNAVGSLIDVVTGLFYKLTGTTYLGSGSSELVEQQDLLTKLFNENIISTFSVFMMITAVVLMTIFGTIAVVKQNYLSKQEARSTAGIIKNMILAFVFILCLTPISLFLISSVTTISSSIVDLFGGSKDVSLADLLFNSSFSGDPINAYNTMYTTEITNWTQMNSSFLFDLDYGTVETNVTFYWYVYLLGGGVILYNLIVIAFGLVKRIFMILILYIVAPVYAAKMVDDGGAKFKEWKNKALSELISIVGTVISFMILISLIGVISDMELVSTTTEVSGGLSGAISEGETQTTINTTALLMNNLTKILLVMAGTAVAKDSGSLLGNAFKGANDDSNSLLEGIFNRLGPKEFDKSGKEQTAPRTRVITKTTTTTRNITDFSADIPISEGNREPKINVTNNQRNSFNTNVNNIDRHINNIQNRSNINVAATSSNDSTSSSIKSGNYRTITSGDEKAKVKPTDALNQSFINSYKQENSKMRKEWELVKGKNSSDSSAVVKEFEGASKELDSAIGSADANKVKASMTKYVTAYKKEEKIAKEGYKEFAGKSIKLSNDLSTQQQKELKNISNAYKKAQMDYGKTARKLTEVSRGNMSVADALGVKEKADKQREKLMEASSRASQFYNNIKKGE